MNTGEKGNDVPTKRAKSQREAFIEAARDLGCSEDADAFDKALEKIAKAPPPKSVEKRKAKKK